MSEATATAAAEPTAAPRGGGAVRREDQERRAARRHDGGPVPHGTRGAMLDGASAALGAALLPPEATLLPPHAPPLVSAPGAAGARVQRASLPELFAGIVSPNREESGGLLIDDDARAVTSGQLRKADFMRLLRAEVCRVADDELRRAGRSAEGCPYLDRMLAYYEGRSADHLERAIRRYAPAARSARSARDYLPPLADRLGRGIARWAATGRMPDDVPDEALAALAGTTSGIVGAIAGIAGLGPQRKAAGPAPDRVDAGALVRRLGPGQPLDGPTRGRMERALGHSFAAVRVHADDLAAALSRDLAARAFTIGPHVAFGAGELQPGTPHGDALLAHELAHVVQQGTAAPAGDVPLGAAHDPLEHDADLAAAAAVAHLHGGGDPAPRRTRASGGVLRLSRCARSAPKSPQASTAPGAMYDTVQHTFVALPAGRSVADMEYNLEQAEDAGNISSWEAEGVRHGSDEHLYVLYAIWQLSHARIWNREVDLVTEIGPGKRGAITVRIDASGNAVGTLISETAPEVAATYGTADEAIKGLKTQYKLSDVRGENGKIWSLSDLNKVAAAWSLLAPEEAAALEGYVLIRTDDTLQVAGKPAAGLTTTGDQVAPDQLSSTRTRELRFADRAFVGDSLSFVGDTENAAPASFVTLLHEAGHAQERKVSVDAESAHIEAQVEMNRAIDRAQQQSQKAYDTMVEAQRTWSGLKRAQRTASKGYADAFSAAFRAVDALRAEPDLTKTAPLQAAAQAAVQARNAARDALPPTHPAVAAFATALTEQDAYLAAVTAELASRQSVETTKASKTAALDPTGKQSARLQQFVDYVNEKGIHPFTKYAKDNWPAHPEEFYAEAFSLWQADPKFLGSAAPELKTWFDAGEHLK